MDYDHLSTIVKACRKVRRLIIYCCTIKPTGTLDFGIHQPYSIQFLSFGFSGKIEYSNWSTNGQDFDDIVKAVNASGLQKSIDTLDLHECGVDTSKVTVGKAKITEMGVIHPMGK